jgi:hypothetical protein
MTTDLSRMEPRTSAATAPVDRAAARRGAVVGLAATVTWLALGAESMLRGGEMHYRDPLQLVPWALTAATFAYLHRAQRRAGGRLERIGFVATMTAMALAAAGQVGVIADIGWLKALGFPLGALLWLVMLVPFGIGTVRAGVVRRRVGVAIALLEPLSIATGIALAPIAGLHDRGAYSGALEKGLVLLVVARGLAEVARARR